MRVHRGIARAVSVACLSVAGLLAVAAPASAETAQQLNVDVTVRPDTVIEVTETLVWDFEGNNRHGIFREFPIAEDVDSEPLKRVTYDVDIQSVTLNGEPVPYAEEVQGDNLVVKVGDAEVWVSGVQTYELKYTIGGALRQVSESDLAGVSVPGVEPGDVELYWDLIGTGWSAPIGAGTGEVTGPGDVLAASCYFGEAGTKGQCPAETAGDSAFFGPLRLWPGEALTASVVYPAEGFTQVPEQNLVWKTTLLMMAVSVVLGILLFAVPVWLAFRWRHRDRGFDTGLSPTQYAAPDGMRPNPLYAAYAGSQAVSKAGRGLVAFILDAASRGFVTVSEEDGLIVTPRADMTVSGDTWADVRSASGNALSEWEVPVMATLLGSPSTPTPRNLSEFDQNLQSVWQATLQGLVEDSELSGIRNPDGDKPDHRWRWLILAASGGGVIAAVAFFGGLNELAWMMLPIVLGSLVGYVFATEITPRSETQVSAVFRAKVRGFLKILETGSAAERRDFAQKSGLTEVALFATMLPYAVALGVDRAWTGAFPNLTPEELQPYGYYVSTPSMHHWVSAGVASASAAVTTPSSSSSGGFGGGGGGSSGGGGGGGGGGSW